MKKREGLWNFRKSDFSSYARKMRITPGSVVLFKEGTITRAGLDAFAEAVTNINIKNVILLVVKDVNDVATLTESEMNKAGWFRVEHLGKIVLDREKKEGTNEEETGKPETGSQA